MNILLLPDTGTAARLADRLADWSAERLLDPFCIWTPTDPGSIAVDRLSLGEREGLPLGDALAEDPERVELVAFYPLPRDEDADCGFAEAVELFIDSVSTVLDFNPDRPLACVMAVAPATAAQRIPQGLFRADWANLVVAPEDRAQPGAANLLEGRGERFLRHAAHAAATVASAWATPARRRPDLPDKLRDEPAGPQRVRLRVMRCFSRVVELGHISDHVAQTVFDRGDGGWPRPGPRFERPADPDPLIADVVGAYIESHHSILRRLPFRPIDEDRLPELGMRDALVKLARQALTYLQRLQSELLEEAMENVYGKAVVYIKRLSGGEIRVKPWREVEGEQGFAELSETLAEGPLLIEDGDVAPAWLDLRQIALGLVDGSRLPDALGPIVRAPRDRRKVVCDPARLARDPAAESDEMEVEYVPMLEQVRAELEASLEAARERAIVLEEAERTARAEREAEAPVKPESAMKRAMRFLRGGNELLKAVRRILGASLLGIVALSVAWVYLSLPWAIVATVLFTGGGYVLGGRLARHVLRLPRIPEDERAARELRELNLALERAQARGDAERLGRRLEELDAWIEILAEMLHRPWVREPFGEFEDVVGTIDEETLPAACSIVVSSSDRRLLERAGSRIKSKAFGIGWLSNIYLSVERRTMEDYYLDHGGSGPRPTPLDPQHDEDSPLGALRKAARRGDGRSRRDNPIAAELLQAIDEAPLDELAPEVSPISPENRPLGPSATWISPPPGHASAARSCGDRVLGLRGWSVTATIVAPGLALTAAFAVTDRLAAAIAPDGSPVEVTRVKFPAGTGLALLQFDAKYGASVEASIAEAHEGVGVVVLEAAADGMSYRWGYVIEATGEDLTVVYDGGDPGPGSSVFDLQGKLLAVRGKRGLLPVPPVDMLREMDDEAPMHAPTRADDAPRAASAFLAGISATNGYRELLPRYWAEFTDANAIDFSHPSLQRIDKSETVAQLTGGAQFMRPLRVMVHRVEVTLPVEPGELFACQLARAEK